MSIKTFIYTCCCVIAFITFMGCPFPNNDSQPNPFPTLRTFQAQEATGASNWYSVPSTLRALGNYCAIYIENSQLSKVNTSTAQSIADEFDDHIYTLIQNKFYTASDVDSNGKIIILFLDIIDDYTYVGSGPYVAGYFSPIHCLNMQHSNRADMLFMDTNPGVPGNTTSKFTIAHEFQHLVNFNKTYIEGSGNQEDVWINEGLSSAAEYLYQGSHITDKIDYYNGSSSKQDLYNGVNFVTWAPSWAISAYTSYATVYLFFQWLRIQAVNGDGIYHDILNGINGNTYFDYHAVEAAAQTRLYSGNWEDFFRDWLIANAFNNAAGKHGYKFEITTTAPYRNYGNSGTLNLYPGEAAYALENSPPFSATSTVTYDKYCGLNTTTNPKSFILDPPFTNCNIILVYNSNGNANGSSVQVNLPINPLIVSLSPGLVLEETMNLEPPKSYPIDAVFPVRIDNSQNIQKTR